MSDAIIREYRPANGAPATAFITSAEADSSVRIVNALCALAREDFPDADIDAAKVRTRADAQSRGRTMLVVRVPGVKTCPKGYTPVRQSPRYVR